MLALAGIPLLIHWLSRRFPKKFIFSSLDDIKRTLAGRSRIRNWRHLIFLALRTLALIALILAFLKPVTGLNDDDGEGSVGQRHVVILVDQSQSMGHRDGNLSTWQRARNETSKLINSLDPLDKLNIILVGRAPRPAFNQFSHNTAAAFQFLEDASPIPAEADFQAANTLAIQLADKAQGPVEFYYVSDFQRKNWANVHFRGLPEKAKLFFIPATDDEQRSNQAILEAALADREPTAGQPFTITVRVGNYSRHHYNGKLEALVPGTPGADTTVALPPWGETELTLELPGLPTGHHAVALKLTDDDLEADNQRFLAATVHESEEVLILTEDASAEPAAEATASPPSRFLRAAVNPFEKGGAYRTKLLDAGTLNSSALAATSKVLASRTPALSDEQAASLAGFLRAGGGMLLFLDGDHEHGNLAKLSEHLGEELPLRLSARLSHENLAGGAMRIAHGDFRSPYLRLFQGERRRNLGFLEFYDLYRAAPTGEGRVLLKYADGTPALTETQVGLGTLLLCNFSVSEISSNLARQRLFPGWIQDLLANMSAARAAGIDYLAGDTIYTEAWASEALGRSIIGPADQEITSATEVRGERLHLSFTAAEAGIYRLPGNGERVLTAFAVNPPERESDLRTLDPGVLPSRAPGKGQARALSHTNNYESIIRGRPAFHLFVLAAIAFLLIEGLLHGALAPKSKPKPEPATT